MERRNTPIDISRTKYKLQLQRMSFLTNDKNYLDHPQNMRRLTKELDRVDREYRNVRCYEDPVKQSFHRLLLKQQQKTAALSIAHNTASGNTGSSSSSYGSSNGSSYSSSPEKFGFFSRWFTPHESSSVTSSY